MTVTSTTARAIVTKLLRRVKGGRIRLVDAHGEAWFGTLGTDVVSVHINDPRVYARVLREGSTGLGESFADGWWDTDDLARFLGLLHWAVASTYARRDRVHRLVRPLVDPIAHLRRPDKQRDAGNIAAHYDLGNDFFAQFLDETMMYSCAVFESPSATLADASIAKLDRLASLLALGPDDHVLEIGTGWGGFAVHAAARYGCRVTTTTLSQSQYEFTRRRIADAGLGERVTVLADDYRDLSGTYDKVVAIEMIEAVDWREYDGFFAHCRRLLRNDGVLALQAIVIPDESFDRVKRSTDFIKHAIFPGGCLPSVAALTAAARRRGFSLAHEDRIGLHYAETLRRWRRRLDDARDEMIALGYDERLVRLFEFYFAYCEAGFAAKYLDDAQLLYTAPAWRPDALDVTRHASPLVRVP